MTPRGGTASLACHGCRTSRRLVSGGLCDGPARGRHLGPSLRSERSSAFTHRLLTLRTEQLTYCCKVLQKAISILSTQQPQRAETTNLISLDLGNLLLDLLHHRRGSILALCLASLGSGNGKREPRADRRPARCGRRPEGEGRGPRVAHDGALRRLAGRSPRVRCLEPGPLFRFYHDLPSLLSGWSGDSGLFAMQIVKASELVVRRKVTRGYVRVGYRWLSVDDTKDATAPGSVIDKAARGSPTASLLKPSATNTVSPPHSTLLQFNRLFISQL